MSLYMALNNTMSSDITVRIVSYVSASSVVLYISQRCMWDAILKKGHQGIDSAVKLTNLMCWVIASAIPAPASLFSLASIVRLLMMALELNVRSCSSILYCCTKAAWFPAIPTTRPPTKTSLLTLSLPLVWDLYGQKGAMRYLGLVCVRVAKRAGFTMGQNAIDQAARRWINNVPDTPNRAQDSLTRSTKACHNRILQERGVWRTRYLYCGKNCLRRPMQTHSLFGFWN